MLIKTYQVIPVGLGLENLHEVTLNTIQVLENLKSEISNPRIAILYFKAIIPIED